MKLFMAPIFFHDFFETPAMLEYEEIAVSVHEYIQLALALCIATAYVAI